eukprot:421628-Prorocentrum_minimum.AAC.1
MSCSSVTHISNSLRKKTFSQTRGFDSPPRLVFHRHRGFDTVTVELTIKTLSSHLVTRKFISPTNSSRAISGFKGRRGRWLRRPRRPVPGNNGSAPPAAGAAPVCAAPPPLAPTGRGPRGGRSGRRRPPRSHGGNPPPPTAGRVRFGGDGGSHWTFEGNTRVRTGAICPIRLPAGLGFQGLLNLIDV